MDLEMGPDMDYSDSEMDSSDSEIDPIDLEMDPSVPKMEYWESVRCCARGSARILVGLLLVPLVVDIDNFRSYYNPTTAYGSVMVCSYRSAKSPTASSDEDRFKIHPYLFPLFLCTEFIVLVILVLFDGSFIMKQCSNTFITSLIFGWGIISLWILLLPVVINYLPSKWNEDDIVVWSFPFFPSFGVSFRRPMIVQHVTLILVTLFRVLYASPKYWIVKNIYDIAFAIESVEVLSVKSFQTGYFSMVVMTTLIGSTTKSRFNCDYFEIVGTGMFLAFLWRFDVSNHFATTYFQYVNDGGYAISSALRLCCKLDIFVPFFTTGALLVYCLWNGDNLALLTLDGTKEVEAPIPQILKGSVEPEIALETRKLTKIINKKETPSRLKEMFARTNGHNRRAI